VGDKGLKRDRWATRTSNKLIIIMCILSVIIMPESTKGEKNIYY
jgi:hypothetical protein